MTTLWESLEKTVSDINQVRGAEFMSLTAQGENRKKYKIEHKRIKGILYIHEQKEKCRIYPSTLELTLILIPRFETLFGRECDGFDQSDKRMPFWRTNEDSLISGSIIEFSKIGVTPNIPNIEAISANSLADDLLNIESENIDPTTKLALTNARIGQGKFRQDVLKSWDNKCAVTGSTIQQVIRASHIKPWRNSDNHERLNHHNGIPLTANLDALFDAGLISFGSDGIMHVSENLSAEDRNIFSISSQSKLRKVPTKEMSDYLSFHCQEVFKP